jgi:hypothetical protein
MGFLDMYDADDVDEFSYNYKKIDRPKIAPRLDVLQGRVVC